MWKFIAGLQSDCALQKATFLQGVTGVEQPASKRCRKLKERVMNAVPGYGQTDIITFLRSLAFLSYQ